MNEDDQNTYIQDLSIEDLKKNLDRTNEELLVSLRERFSQNLLTSMIFFMFKYKLKITNKKGEILYDGIPIRIMKHIGNVIYHIRSEYQWLDPKRFDSLESFLDKAIYYIIEYYFHCLNDELKDFELIRKKFTYIVKDIVINEFYDEIKRFFNKK